MRTLAILGLLLAPTCVSGARGLGFGLHSYDIGDERCQTVRCEGKRSRRAEVNLDFGPGSLFVEPGDGAAIEVTSRGNVRELEPVLVEREWAGTLRVDLGPAEMGRGLPIWDWDELENHWDVRLARDLPMDLDLQIGAAEAELDLGGLRLERLRMELGVGEVQVDFSEPNFGTMEFFEVEAGTGEVCITRLGNANARRVSFEGGLGHFELDLAGEWLEPATMTVEAGLCEVELRVPPDLPVRVVADTSLAEVTPVGFRERGGAWVNRACERSDVPWVEIQVEVGLGSLMLIED